MDKTMKILIIACIVLVGALSLTIGMLIKGPSTSQQSSAIVNSNNSVNTTPEVQVKQENSSLTQTNSKSKDNSQSIYADPNQVYNKAKSYVKSHYPSGYSVTYPVLGYVKLDGTYGNYYMSINDANNEYVRTLKANSHTGELNI